MLQEKTLEKQRIRINISTTAKGKAQIDATVEMIDENPEEVKKLLIETLEVAKASCKEAGFELAE